MPDARIPHPDPAARLKQIFDKPRYGSINYSLLPRPTAFPWLVATRELTEALDEFGGKWIMDILAKEVCHRFLWGYRKGELAHRSHVTLTVTDQGRGQITVTARHLFGDEYFPLFVRDLENTNWPEGTWEFELVATNIAKDFAPIQYGCVAQLPLEA